MSYNCVNINIILYEVIGKFQFPSFCYKSSVIICFIYVLYQFGNKLLIQWIWGGFVTVSKNGQEQQTTLRLYSFLCHILRIQISIFFNPFMIILFHKYAASRRCVFCLLMYDLKVHIILYAKREKGKVWKIYMFIVVKMKFYVQCICCFSNVLRQPNEKILCNRLFILYR